MIKRNQLLTMTVKIRRCPSFDPVRDIRDSRLTLLSHDGSVLEEHSLFDLLNAKPDLFTFQKVELWKEGIDLFHCNSVEWMHWPDLELKHSIYAASNILVCIRHQDTVAIIDWDKKELVWAWGQGQVSGPHDATMLAGGNILLFDNGLGRGWSRVIELNPLTKEIVWQYRAPNPTDMYTVTRGASQRLPNGNTLIANSEKGQAFEVTPEGRIVWEFLSPHFNAEGHRGTIVRMKRYELEYVQRIQEQHKEKGRPDSS